jgi:hypothetical protein
MTFGKTTREIGVLQWQLYIRRPFAKEPRWGSCPIFSFRYGRLLRLPPEGTALNPKTDWRGIWWVIENPIENIILYRWRIHIAGKTLYLTLPIKIFWRRHKTT